MLTKLKQTRHTSQDNSRKGNCMQACLASLLGLNHILKAPDLTKCEGVWVAELDFWLQDKGYTFEGMHFFQDGGWDMLLQESPGVDGHFIIGGDSPREWVAAGHAVIYKDNKMVWDPHFSHHGLTTMRYAYLIQRNNNGNRDQSVRGTQDDRGLERSGS